jgi:hypothetical protein
MAHPHEAELHELHPTQITVGVLEVRVKRLELEALSTRKQREFLQEHAIPAVFGPDDRVYITDHHHLARAALEAGIESGVFLIEADMRQLEGGAFWSAMDAKLWAHPIDEHGRRQSFTAIPKHLEELRDDVYRSLAGFVRSAGGFQKTPTAFAEFAWADFFRRRILVGPTPEDFERAVAAGLALARSAAARELPGYCGARS